MSKVFRPTLFYTFTSSIWVVVLIYWLPSLTGKNYVGDTILGRNPLLKSIKWAHLYIGCTSAFWVFLNLVTLDSFRPFDVLLPSYEYVERTVRGFLYTKQYCQLNWIYLCNPVTVRLTYYRGCEWSGFMVSIPLLPCITPFMFPKTNVRKCPWPDERERDQDNCKVCTELESMSKVVQVMRVLVESTVLYFQRRTGYFKFRLSERLTEFDWRGTSNESWTSI